MTQTEAPPAKEDAKAGLVPCLPTDTCDGCGNRALTAVILPSGKILTFCGHHAKPFGWAPENTADTLARAKASG